MLKLSKQWNVIKTKEWNNWKHVNGDKNKISHVTSFWNDNALSKNYGIFNFVFEAETQKKKKNEVSFFHSEMFTGRSLVKWVNQNIVTAKATKRMSLLFPNSLGIIMIHLQILDDIFDINYAAVEGIGNGLKCCHKKKKKKNEISLNISCHNLNLLMKFALNHSCLYWVDKLIYTLFGNPVFRASKNPSPLERLLQYYLCL